MKKSLRLLSRFWWVFTNVLFVVGLFMAYKNWPYDICVQYNAEQVCTKFMPRENVFISSIIVVAVVNILFVGIAALMSFVSKSLLIVPNRSYWTETPFRFEYAIGIIKNWAYAFAGWMNMFFANCLLVVSMLNYETYDNGVVHTLADFWWLPSALVAIAGMHTLFLLIRFYIKKTPEDNF